MMSSNRRNMTPSPKPKHYSNIWHADIGFGPWVAIGAFWYTLMLLDKYSRFKFMYNIKKIIGSLQTALEQLIINAVIQPKMIRTDFDQKIIGGKVEEFLLD